MRVLFLTHYFPPELGAASPRVFETARRLAAAGHDVTVLTGFPHYPTGVVADEYRGRLEMREEMSGVRVLRSWVWATPNSTAIRRTLNQMSLALTSLWGSRQVGDVDVIVVETPPLMLTLSGYLLARWKNVPMVLRIADLWPASAVRLGVLRDPTVIKAAEAVERFIYRRSDRIVAVTAGIRDELLRRGVSEKRVVYMPNGVNTELFASVPDTEPIRERFGLQGKYVVLYAGNIGLAQGLDSLLDAAALLRPDEDLQFVLAGEGVERARLQARAREEGLDNVSFLGGQPRDRMPELLSMADASLVPLVADPFFEMAVPSKLLEAMACERPVILAARGEAERLLAEAGAGVAVPPQDAGALVDAASRLKGDRAAAGEMGKRGRRYVLEHFDWGMIGERFEGLLAEVVQGDREQAAAGATGERG